MQVRAGIIGAGFAANIHATAYARVQDVDLELVAVAGLPLADAEAFARRHSIPTAYDDYRRVLEREDINVVDVCVPNALHHLFVIAAAEAGKHVICEKPLTGYFGGETASDPVGATPKSVMLAEAMRGADRMLDAANRSGVKLMYAENWVYSPPIQKALDLVTAAGGTILQIRAEESHSGSHAPYAKTWAKAGGGSLIRLATHPIGAALFLKQQEGLHRAGRPIRPASVMAETDDLTKIASFQTESRHWIVDGWLDVENWCALIITFEDGSRALITASDIVLGGMEDVFEVYMSNGRIHCDMGHSGLIRAFAPDPVIWENAYIMEKVDHKGGWSFPSVDEQWMLGYDREIQHFVECVANDSQPLSTAELGRDVVEVVYAAYQSAEEGRRIELR
jgi:predicted dehydrogenase